jgi:hypothetical protein
MSAIGVLLLLLVLPCYSFPSTCYSLRCLLLLLLLLILDRLELGIQ